MSIKNPVNVWWNEKKLVPLHQNKETTSLTFKILGDYRLW